MKTISERSITRRTFLRVSFTTAGSLVVGAYFGFTNPAFAQTPTPTGTPTVTDDAFQPNLFVRVAKDGTVTLTVQRSEMGQGVHTALAMILAEELEADWSKVKVIQSPNNATIKNTQVTGGSGSVADNYTSLRSAGARARGILIAAAAQTWSVKPEECHAENGEVLLNAGGKKLGYGELVEVAQTIKSAGSSKTKDPKDFKLIGTSVPRVDGPDIVTGKALYGLDTRVPGMVFATVARCPVPGGTVKSFDAANAKAVPGVINIYKVPSGVAVVAKNTWSPMQGRDALTIVWDEGKNVEYSSASIRAQLAALVEKATANEKAGDLKTIDAVYETPYLGHAAMEPVNCIADVQDDHVDIWAPTQNPRDAQLFVEKALGLPTNVNVTLLGGGFGRRLEIDYALEAAHISKAAGAPVQVVWTREDDMQHDYYRQPTHHWLRAGWDTTGKLALWRHYIVAQGLNGIAYRVGSEVLEEGLAVPYTIADRKNEAILASVPLPTGPWRAVMAATNGFANECFFDKVAAALNQDPYEFRKALIPSSLRMSAVLDLAATKTNWGTAVAAGRARGIACHTYHSTSVAMVAEVSVSARKLKVHKVVCALDCGTVVNPDMVAQQMEGSIAYALSSLLTGEITFELGRVQQSNFNDYPILKMDEMPEVEVHSIVTDRVPTGVGEMGVPPLIPAVLNAVFTLTGKRIRHTPLRADDLA